MKTLTKGLVLSAVAGALFASSSTPAKAQNETMAAPMPVMVAPTPVSGKIVTYYIDRTGYVTAADVQTADGVRFVRFSPTFAQRMVSMYPVGTDTTVYVTSTPEGSKTRYDVVGIGDQMPAPSSMMAPYTITDLDILRATPYTVIGAKTMRVTGKVTNYVSDPVTGEVLALMLDNKTVVRVPRENRLVQASPAPEGVTRLYKGAYVEAYGYPEAPRYGTLSPFGSRLIATGLAVDGDSVGPLGFGTVIRGDKDWQIMSTDTYYQYVPAGS